jgi:hypothetical protein
VFVRPLGRIAQINIEPPLGGAFSESASRPLSGFWCLNDKAIKELMSFAMYETEKMSCNYGEAIRS